MIGKWRELFSNGQTPRRLQKAQGYLSDRDLRGLAREVEQFFQWYIHIPPPPRHFTESIEKLRISEISQNTEYATLKKLANHCTYRYLVDIGAHDGKSWSNSRPFMLQGWSGILVEPLPLPFQQLEHLYSSRENVTTLCLACSDEMGDASLFIGTDGVIGMGSTLCQDENVWFDTHRSSQTLTVKTDTLTNILADADSPRNFGLLLIDAEGMDYEVLLGLDFSLWKPEIIVSEEYVVSPQKQIDKYTLLVNNSYILYTVIEGTNAVWLHQDFAKKLNV